MIVKSINESKINEALPAPLSQSLKLRDNKSLFQKVAQKLRVTLDDTTLANVERITNRDKRLRDKDYVIFFIIGDSIAVYQGGKDIGYGGTDNRSWTDLINSSNYIYALYLPDARDDKKLLARDKRNQYMQSKQQLGIKDRAGAKNLSKLFIPKGDGTYKIDHFVFDKINKYIDDKSDELLNRLVKSETPRNVVMMLSSRQDFSDAKIRTEIFSLSKVIDDLDKFQSELIGFERVTKVIDDSAIEFIFEYIDTYRVLYILDLIK